MTSANRGVSPSFRDVIPLRGIPLHDVVPQTGYPLTITSTHLLDTTLPYQVVPPFTIWPVASDVVISQSFIAGHFESLHFSLLALVTFTLLVSGDTVFSQFFIGGHLE